MHSGSLGASLAPPFVANSSLPDARAPLVMAGVVMVLSMAAMVEDAARVPGTFLSEAG